MNRSAQRRIATVSLVNDKRSAIPAGRQSYHWSLVIGQLQIADLRLQIESVQSAISNLQSAIWINDQ
jgi:hypothetical protein